ncbi:Hypp6773 [Branchiostoma lanceolatum]|uniref:Hypp6773 protein n=1 Tax=Branchiostoma lanceolatum TaxID=7740 RepID=A0A8J9YVI6_BRALA|nr:Hypp6773 [Branchiostoma lanceolatum]
MSLYFSDELTRGNLMGGWRHEALNPAITGAILVRLNRQVGELQGTSRDLQVQLRTAREAALQKDHQIQELERRLAELREEDGVEWPEEGKDRRGNDLPRAKRRGYNNQPQEVQETVNKWCLFFKDQATVSDARDGNAASRSVSDIIWKHLMMPNNRHLLEGDEPESETCKTPCVIQVLYGNGLRMEVGGEEKLVRIKWYLRIGGKLYNQFMSWTIDQGRTAALERAMVDIGVNSFWIRKEGTKQGPSTYKWKTLTAKELKTAIEKLPLHMENIINDIGRNGQVPIDALEGPQLRRILQGMNETVPHKMLMECMEPMMAKLDRLLARSEKKYRYLAALEDTAISPEDRLFRRTVNTFINKKAKRTRFHKKE